MTTLTSEFILGQHPTLGPGEYGYDLFTLFQHISEATEHDVALYRHYWGWIHKRVHWYQHHGTTIGALLSLLQHAQEVTTMTAFRRLPEAERRSLAAQREHTNGRPCITIDP